MRQKVFGIGFNKTGTTTLASVLQCYGYRLPDQAYQEKEIAKSTFDGEYKPMSELVGRFDAFQDMPFSQGSTYKVVNELFPDSKFILTTRDPEAWFSSLCSFHKKVFNVACLKSITEADVRNKFHYLYDGYVYENMKRFLTEVTGDKAVARWDLLYNKDFYIERYLQRNAEVRKYFSACGGCLLIIDVTRERTTAKLCDFLSIPSILTIPMPHENRTFSSPSRLDKLWSNLKSLAPQRESWGGIMKWWE